MGCTKCIERDKPRPNLNEAFECQSWKYIQQLEEQTQNWSMIMMRMRKMMKRKFKGWKLSAHQHVNNGQDSSDEQSNHDDNEYKRKNSVVPLSYVPVSMKNNNSHPGADIHVEDMNVETLDILGLAAQVTKVVNDKLFPNCKIFWNEHEVNYLVGFVFHDIGMCGTKWEHRFEYQGFWHSIQSHNFQTNMLQQTTLLW